MHSPLPNHVYSMKSCCVVYHGTLASPYIAFKGMYDVIHDVIDDVTDDVIKIEYGKVFLLNTPS